MRVTRQVGGTVAALDVGSTKVCCFIAEDKGGEELEVRGVGLHRTRGLRSGAIVDMEAVRSAVLAAVHSAEQMAGERLYEVFVNLTCGQPASATLDIEVAIDGHEINHNDVRRVLEQGRLAENGTERELIHSIPVCYRIDGNRGIRDPRGMYGRRLGVDMHVVTAAAGSVRNLTACVRGCHLDVSGYVVSPYAAALACLTEDEMELGVTVIDMGGGTTSLCVFDGGELVYTDGIPVGGLHVTNDIAHGLSTPVKQAERIKTLYGNAVSDPSDDSAMIDVPPIGEEDATTPHHVQRSLLIGVIRPRLEEIFEMLRAKLEMSGHFGRSSRRVVLTGGASQLRGAKEMAAQVLDKQVRLGRPLGFKGLAEAMSGPGFSTCAGLLRYAREGHYDGPPPRVAPKGEPHGLMGRIGHWLQENF